MDVSKQWISLVPYRRPGHFANVAHLGFRHGWRRSSKPSQCPTPRRQRSTVFCLPSKMCKWTSIGQILTIWGRVFTKVTVAYIDVEHNAASTPSRQIAWGHCARIHSILIILVASFQPLELTLRQRKPQMFDRKIIHKWNTLVDFPFLRLRVLDKFKMS